MHIISNTSKLKSYVLIVSFSLILTEFYFFNWKTQFFVSNGYLIFNSLFLFIFSIFLFSIFYFIYSKINLVLSEQLIKIIDTFLITFILFKLIQIPFFQANIIEFKTLIAILLSKIFTKNLFFLVSILKILLPFSIIFFSIFFLNKRYLEIVINFIISFSFVLSFFMILDISKRLKSTFYDNLDMSNSNNNRKVIWILLDEYDPSYINNEYGLKLENIKKIVNNSLIHHRTFAPSDSTIYSAPSTLMKTQIKDLFFEDFRMKVLDNNNNKIDFSIRNTIFKTVLDNKFSFQIFSEALPYCTMLRIKNNCEKNYNDPKFYFDSIKSSFVPFNYFTKIKEILNKRSNFSITRLNNHKIKNEKIFLSKDLNIDINQFKKILDTKDNLLYFHLFLPHTNNQGRLVSSKHVRDEFNMNAYTDLEKYLIKLKYTDMVLKEIYNILDKNNDNEILLLLTSDHWRRIDSPKNAKPSLFVAKIFGDNQNYQLENDILNLFIPDLIMAFLKKEIRSHKEIKLFLKNLPFFDSKATDFFNVID